MVLHFVHSVHVGVFFPEFRLLSKLWVLSNEVTRASCHFLPKCNNVMYHGRSNGAMEQWSNGAIANGAKMWQDVPLAKFLLENSLLEKRKCFKLFQYISAEVAHSPYSSHWTWLESAASSEGPELAKDN